MAELDDVIDLKAMLGRVRRLSEKLVNQRSGALFILVQVFLGQLLMRFQGHAAVPPEMETEGADAAQDRHDGAIKTQMAMAMLCVLLDYGAPKQTAQASAWPLREEDKRQPSAQNFRFHVMIRSRFIFL